ncbi:MAG: YtxH domain-containing protein [Acidimicrobiales bacterium]|nr:YtxH domain-containing protein [Actinomycetota bacterium]
MRFRLGFVTGFAGGYYLGTKAGRQRYEQISQTLQRVRASEAFETAATKAKAAVDEGVDKAKDLIDRRSDGATDDGSPNGTATIPTAATTPTTDPTGLAPPYSSSK